MQPCSIDTIPWFLMTFFFLLNFSLQKVSAHRTVFFLLSFKKTSGVKCRFACLRRERDWDDDPAINICKASPSCMKILSILPFFTRISTVKRGTAKHLYSSVFQKDKSRWFRNWLQLSGCGKSHVRVKKGSSERERARMTKKSFVGHKRYLKWRRERCRMQPCSIEMTPFAHQFLRTEWKHPSNCIVLAEFSQMI